VLDRFGYRQRPHEVAEIEGELMKLEVTALLTAAST
jgi:hypothetical protein